MTAAVEARGRVLDKHMEEGRGWEDIEEGKDVVLFKHRVVLGRILLPPLSPYAS